GLHAAVNVSNSEGNLDSLLVTLGAGDDTFSAASLAVGVAMLSVNGGFGNDSILGSPGEDLLFWGEDNDLIDGAGCNDLLQGGDGDDTFQSDPGDGNDTVQGDAGDDTIVFNGGSATGETFEMSDNQGRLRFTRSFGNTVMDVDDVERVDVEPTDG